jgi:hypothetical protein
MRVRILSSALDDLAIGREFYERQAEGDTSSVETRSLNQTSVQSGNARHCRRAM